MHPATNRLTAILDATPAHRAPLNLNPYTVRPRRNCFYVIGPNGYARKRSDQADAQQLADDLNRVYRLGVSAGRLDAETLDAELEQEEAQ